MYGLLGHVVASLHCMKTLVWWLLQTDMQILGMICAVRCLVVENATDSVSTSITIHNYCHVKLR